MKPTKKWIALFLALVMACSLAACTSKQETTKETETQDKTQTEQTQTTEAEPSTDGDAAKYGGVFKIGLGTDVLHIGYPQLSLTFQASLIADTCLEHLCRYNEDGTLQPWLCTAYEEDPDAMTLTVHLREGIKFHDGSDFNAEAVVWNWEKWTECGNMELTGVDKYEIIDEHTIVVHLKNWSNSIATACLYTAGTIISKDYAEANGTDAADRNPVGTGPFKFASWVTDQKVVFEANKDYWIDGMPYLDGVEFHFIKDAATQSSAFMAGEVDAIIDCSSDTSMTLKSKGFTSETKPLVSGAATSIFWFSCQDKGPMGNVDARRAIASAIDMDAIWEYCSSQTGAIYDRTIQWGPNNVWSSNPETKGYPYDPQAAKDYLKKAGYPDGFDMVIYYMTNSSESESICVLVQDYLAEVGIKASIEAIEQARLDDLSGVKGEAYTGMVLSAGRAEVDLSTYYNRTFLPDGVRWVNQVNHYDDIVETLQNAMSCKTFDEKKNYSQQLSKMVIDDYCQLLPMWTSSSAIFTNGNVADHGIYQINYIIWTPETAHFTK